ncbi:MAG: GntR family transcriptional regulator [Acidobacteriota bacterium]
MELATSDDYRVSNQRVLEKLSEQIISGKIKPGDRIPERALARELGCSIVPVREALGQLIAWGVLRKAPHVGTFARSLTAEEMMAHSELRLVMYTYVVGRAAVDPDLEALDEFERALDVYEGGLRAGAERDWSALDDDDWSAFITQAIRDLMQVYAALIKTARLATVASLYEQEELLYILSTRQFWGLMPRESMLAYIKNSYLERPFGGFIPAVKDRDPERAQRLHREQFQAAAHDVMSRIAAAGVELPIGETDVVLSDVRLDFEAL